MTHWPYVQQPQVIHEIMTDYDHLYTTLSDINTDPWFKNHQRVTSMINNVHVNNISSSHSSLSGNNQNDTVAVHTHIHTYTHVHTCTHMYTHSPGSTVGTLTLQIPLHCSCTHHYLCLSCTLPQEQYFHTWMFHSPQSSTRVNLHEIRRKRGTPQQPDVYI